VLEDVVQRWNTYVDGYVLLASIWESRREFERAGAVYRRALSVEGMAPNTRSMLTAKLAALGSRH
jgi:Tfp pilus assembly protein PilF